MTERNCEKNLNHFCQNRDLNSELSEYEPSVMNFDLRCALCIEKNYHRRTSQSAGAGIRVSVFNRCNNATVTTRGVPLVHAVRPAFVSYVVEVCRLGL